MSFLSTVSISSDQQLCTPHSAISHHFDHLNDCLFCCTNKPSPVNDDSTACKCLSCSAALFSVSTFPEPIQPPETSTTPNCILVTITMIGSIHNHHSTLSTYLSVLDTGGSHTMLHARCLPQGVQPIVLDNQKSFSTTAGKMFAKHMVQLNDITLPIFTKTKQISEELAYFFDDPNIPFDIIWGRTFLQNGFVIDFDNARMIWQDRSIAMETLPYWNQISHKNDVR